MVEVIVKGLGTVKKLIPKPITVKLNVGNETVGGVLSRVAELCGEPFIKGVYSPHAGELADGVFVLLNGRRIEFIGGLRAKVKSGDVIAIGAVSAGG